MSSSYLVIAVIALYLLGYFIYSRFLEKKIFKIDNSIQTPAHELRDDKDFLPTRKLILFGHHYASIAGVAPIIGPCIALYWGWLPAILWLVLGNIFMGAMHDMAALYLSVKHKAKSLAYITGELINKKTKLAFLILIVFLLWIVSAAFVVVMAKLLNSYPQAVLPMLAASVIAVVMGFVIYKLKIHGLLPSLLSLFLLYASIPVGIKYPIDLKMIFAIDDNQALIIWVLLLLTYAVIASVLPVWVLLQPRDYINSHQIVVALIILLAGVFFTAPKIVAPAINHDATLPWFPFLFITIACGAISGAHGLVSAGTTSKQIAKESDIRPIAYGSMLLEGFLALLAVIAASAGFRDKAAWSLHYHSWTHASEHALDAFINGCVSFLTGFNLAPEIAASFIAVIIISFASTSLDTFFRIQRYLLAEMGELAGVKVLKQPMLGSLLAFISALALVFSDGFDSLSGAFRLWPVFGTSNQLVAALTLILVLTYLQRQKQSAWWILIPTFFISAITIFAGINSCMKFFTEKNYLLSLISLGIFLLQILVIVEALKVRFQRSSHS